MTQPQFSCGGVYSSIRVGKRCVVHPLNNRDFWKLNEQPTKQQQPQPTTTTTTTTTTNSNNTNFFSINLIKVIHIP